MTKSFEPEQAYFTTLLTSLRSAASVTEIVDIIRAGTRQLLAADGIAVVRREGQEVRYIAEDAVGPLWVGQSFPLPACISGLAIRDCAPILIPDISNDPRVPFNAYQGTFVRSMIMVPLGTNRPRGAIGAYWDREGAPSGDALRLLEQLAVVAEAAIQKVETADANLMTYASAA